MERYRPRLRFSWFPRLLAAAVIVECCSWLCPSLGSETGPTLGTAIPCARLGTVTGERCQTDPEQEAGTGQAPTPEAVGQLRTETELLPSPETHTGTAELPSPQGNPGGPRAGGEGSTPVAQEGTATESLGLSAGTAELAAVGSDRPTPAPVPLELGTAPAVGSAPGTAPGAHVTAEGATAPQRTLSHLPSFTTVPSSAGGQWEPSSTLPGGSPTGTGLVHRQGGSHGPSSPEPWAGEGLGATILLGGSNPGTRPSTAPAADSPALGTVGTSPVAGELQRVLSPTWGDVDQQGPFSAPHSSLGAGGHGGPMASTAQPAMGTGKTFLPAAGKGSGLPVPTAMAGTPGMTSSGLERALDPTTGPPEHSHVPLDQTWQLPAMAGQPPTSVTPSSTAVAQGKMPYTSPESSPVPLSRQPAPTNSSAAPPSPTPQPSTGVPGLSPAAGTPVARPSPGYQLPQAGSGGNPAESPQILVGDAGLWAVTAPPSWQPDSLAPTAAPGPLQQPAPSQPASSLASAAAPDVTTATIRAPRGDEGAATPEPSAVVLRGDVAGLTRGPPTHLRTAVTELPQQPTHRPGTLAHRGDPGFPSAAGDTDPAQPSSSPGGRPGAGTLRVTPAPRVFVVEDQPPVLRASLLRIPCELVLDMGFVPALRDPASRERQGLLHSFNRTVSPLFAAVPGFLRLEVTGIREGSVVLEYDALFAAEQVLVPGLGELLDAVLGSGGAQTELVVGTAPVLSNVVLGWPLDPCSVLFSCRDGFVCVVSEGRNATCTSLCHRDYCKNHGICTHPRGRGPLCQCPVGSDFWFVGLRCDYRVTQQSLLGMAAGILLSIVLLAAVIAAVAIRRFKVLLLEARADQTRSSYRRFCRLDDVSAQYWSRSWLPSASSLDNPAFSTSEELLHLQVLDAGCCGCQEDSGTADGTKQQHPDLPARPLRQPSFHYEWDTSSSSMNDPMVDSGKASDISVSSWPMEPLQWTPFPLLHQLSRQRPHKARRPHSYCEGMELGNLERSWTA
ncbi:collagen alpha-2(I) chain-like [Melanerpes formicivorus]|uniref:collagen alpha-2(I) chain-like n=1 Tax=Melanerpes formicivorus TaxID=211600 RepID=UPI00358DFB46